MGIFVQISCLQADFFQQIHRPVVKLLFADLLKRTQGFRDNRRHRHPWIQTCLGILKNHLHISAKGSHLSSIQVGNLHAIKPDAPGSRLQKSKYDAAQGGFTTSGFTHKAKAFTFVYLERHTINRFYQGFRL